MERCHSEPVKKDSGLTQRFSQDVDILVVPAVGVGSSRIDRALTAIISQGAEDLGLEESQVKVGPPPRASSATPGSSIRRVTRPPR